VHLSRLTVRDGFSLFAGGGVFNQGDLTIDNASLTHNQATVDGGGIYTSQGTLRVIASVISNNAAGSSGGGLYALGPATLTDSTIRNNAAGNGGGIYNNSNALNIVNSTLSGNTANNNGGGIFSRISAFLYNTSVIDNDADDDHDENGGVGGGVHADPGSRFVLVNSLVASNYFVSYVEADDCSGTIEVYGRNLFVQVNSWCSFSGNGSPAWGLVTPQTIGPLLDNGGPTPTHALLAGSEAIDSTTAQGCVDNSGSLLVNDQRGADRIAGLRCDVGAVESGSIVPIDDLIFRDGFDPGM
jgi:predicted outer membrane repeat protein